jgi:hypothetical protein
MLRVVRRWDNTEDGITQKRVNPERIPYHSPNAIPHPNGNPGYKDGHHACGQRLWQHPAGGMLHQNSMLQRKSSGKGSPSENLPLGLWHWNLWPSSKRLRNRESPPALRDQPVGCH